MLVHYFPDGLLGLGLTALMASFMSGMAGNVTAFNTVWTYDIYQSYIAPKRSDSHYLWVGRLATVFGIAHQRGGRLCGLALEQHHGRAATGVRVRQRPAVRHVPAGHVLEAHHRPWRLLGLLGGHAGRRDPSWPDASAASRGHGKGRMHAASFFKGGWFAVVHVYPSEMAQGFGPRFSPGPRALS